MINKILSKSLKEDSSYKYLSFMHIPKCAGTSIDNSIITNCSTIDNSSVSDFSTIDNSSV